MTFLLRSYRLVRRELASTLGPSSPRPAGLLVLLLRVVLTVAAASLYLFAFELADLERELSVPLLIQTTLGRWELILIALASSLLLLVPLVVLSSVLSLGRSRLTSSLMGMVFAWLGWATLLFDRSLYGSTGRHLRGVVSYLFSPQAGQAAGHWGVWLSAAFFAAWVAALLVLVSEICVQCLAGMWARGLRPSWLERTVAWLALIAPVFVLLIGYYVSNHSVALDEGLRERLFETRAFDFRLVEFRAQVEKGSLKDRLQAAYLRRYSKLRGTVRLAPKRADASVRPPIVLIVVESWRRSSLSEQLMPRLYNWSRSHAKLLPDHQAGTYSSEAGMFSLLYGRSNLSFHETLDAKVAPLLFSFVRGLDYEVRYYTGHPIVWLRREEFLSKSTVDHLRFDQDGDWPAWDRKALSALREDVSSATSPALYLSFLMSTHFAYEYPPSYERNLPVARAKWFVGQQIALTEADRELYYNRYKNSLAYLDDLITETVSSLPEDCVVLVTGDHGESFYEGRHYGHGTVFNDAVLQVPMIARFPTPAPAEDPAPTVTGTTLHRDVPGWVARYLAGQDAVPDGFQGRADWSETASRPIFSSYASPGQRLTYGALHLPTGFGPKRLRMTLRNREPRLTVLGWEDSQGLPLADPGLSPRDIDRVVAAFEAELDAMIR